MTVSQAFVYKGNKAELHDKDVADRMKADEGWFDNPTDAKDPPKPETAKAPEKAEEPIEETPEAPESKTPKPKPAAKPKAKKAAKGK